MIYTIGAFEKKRRKKRGIYDMYCLDIFLKGKKPSDIIDLIDFENFDLNDNYFKWDWQGISSYSDKDYSNFLDYNFIDEFIRYYDNLYIDNDFINNLFENME